MMQMICLCTLNDRFVMFKSIVCNVQILLNNVAKFGFLELF